MIVDFLQDGIDLIDMIVTMVVDGLITMTTGNVVVAVAPAADVDILPIIVACSIDLTSTPSIFYRMAPFIILLQ